MSDSKIKIKDLAAELKMDAKELLQELQSMGFNVKSAQGSIPMEEVSGVRDRVAENRQRKADRKDDQPTVIVRRRRVKDEAPAEEQPVAETKAEAAPEKAPEPAAPVETPAARVISVPEPEKAPEVKPEPVKAEPKAEKTPEPVAPVETPAARVVAAPEAEKAPEAKPEPVKNEAKAEPRTEAKREARVEKATPQTARVVAPAGARVISRPDATPTARIIRPAQAAAPVTKTEAKPEPKPEKAPEAKPEVRKSAVLAAINAKEAAENGAAEKAAKPRTGRPDASAMPEGSSAPTLPQREARENRDDRPAEATPTRARVVAPAPQVRVISRPQPGAAPARDSRDSGRDRDGGRDGRDRDGRDNRSGRPGGNRSGFGDRPRGGAPRPAGGGYSAPAPAAPLDSRDGQSNSLVADLVRILGDGAVEPALTDRVLLGSACVKAGDDQTRVLAALSQILAVGDSSQEAGDSALVGAEDRNGVHAQQGVGSGLDRGSLGGSGDGDLNDDGGSVDLLFPLGVAFDGDLAGLIGFSDLGHFIDEAGGTAGDGSGDSVLRQAADDDGVVGGRVLHGLNDALMLVELVGSDGGSVFVVGAGGRLDSAGGIAGNAGVKADDGDVLFRALFQDLGDSVGGQSSQRHGLGVLGELGLDHVDLCVDLSLGSGAVEVDLYAEILGSILGALGDCLPELMLEALRHDGDVHLLAGGLSGRSFLGGRLFGGGGFFGRGGGLGGGFGLCGLGLGGAGSQSEDHDQCQKQSDQFFHLVIPPKLFYQTRVPCSIHDEYGT